VAFGSDASNLVWITVRSSSFELDTTHRPLLRSHYAASGRLPRAASQHPKGVAPRLCSAPKALASHQTRRFPPLTFRRGSPSERERRRGKTQEIRGAVINQKPIGRTGIFSRPLYRFMVQGAFAIALAGIPFLAESGMRGALSASPM
jgi:hypothetical protein